jgi:hypothetical protein
MLRNGDTRLPCPYSEHHAAASGVFVKILIECMSATSVASALHAGQEKNCDGRGGHMELQLVAVHGDAISDTSTIDSTRAGSACSVCVCVCVCVVVVVVVVVGWWRVCVCVCVCVYVCGVLSLTRIPNDAA